MMQPSGPYLKHRVLAIISLLITTYTISIIEIIAKNHIAEFTLLAGIVGFVIGFFIPKVALPILKNHSTSRY